MKLCLAAAVVAPGLMVLAIILCMGAVSGAHLTPADLRLVTFLATHLAPRDERRAHVRIRDEPRS
jgi:hypothetical protein